jgi:pyruvate/2-oxoglutarate dehydrogenase complex dihydrolipoamide dehydrogenase (E3) component
LTWELKNALKEIVARESGAQVFAPGARRPVAFIYPNTYHLGMSNLGLHILYQLINSRGDSACERFFLPDSKLLAEHKRTKTPLLSLETQRPLADFEVICVMMSFEMDYTNLLTMLAQSNVKLEAAARGAKEPLVIIGGGVIGMEFASFFNSMGTEVHVVEMLDKILGPMDRELSEMLQAEYAKRGVKFYLGHKVTAVNGGDVTVEKDGETSVIQGEKVLLSVGRRPVTKGFGLETLAPEPFRNGIKVNGFMQTSVPNVYACGDITAFSLLAHTAVSEAEVAVDHILGKNRSMSYKAIPGVVYTNPEIAGVGKTEEELQAEGTPYTVKKIPMAFSCRFVAENEQGNGICKLILAEDETIIGAHLLGNPASELIVIAGIAVEKGMKASELKSIVFPHPTVGEILKEAL